MDRPVREPAATVLDLAFDSGTLHALRSGLKAHARRAGLSADRAEDVVLAVHELAANAVYHGAGTGRLRVWRRAGALLCQVEDGDPPAARGQAALNPLPSRPGHGLWVVRRLADRMRVLSGARGTRATVTFDLPGQGCPNGEDRGPTRMFGPCGGLTFGFGRTHPRRTVMLSSPLPRPPRGTGSAPGG